MNLPLPIYEGLQRIGSKAAYLLSILESRTTEALDNSTPTSILIAYRKSLEAESDLKLPRSVLMIKGQALANQRKLDSCPQHNFGRYDRFKSEPELMCKNCQGWMKLDRIFDLVKKHKDSGGNPEDILQGLYEHTSY